MSDEDDGPFSAFKSLIDQLRQRDENLIPKNFTYKDILTVDDDFAVMGGVMTDEERKCKEEGGGSARRRQGNH